MPYKIIGDYTKPVPMPNMEQAKSYKWFLDTVRHLFHLYQTGRMSTGYGGRCLRTWRDIGTKRAYFFNQQDITPIREQLDPLDAKTNTRIYNIDWTKVDFHSKTLNNVYAKVTQFNYVPKTTAIDEASVNQKNYKANKAKLLSHPEIKSMAEMVGYKDDDDLGLDDGSDVDAINELGGIRLKAEIDLKNAVEHSLLDASFRLALQEMFVRDLIVDNRMVASCEINPNTGRPYPKYVDIARCFYTNSIYPDARDMSAWGYTEEMSIPQLRTYLSKEKNKKGDGATKYNDIEKVLLDCCKKYTNTISTNVMPEVGLGSLTDFYDKNGYYPHDHFSITVATFGFIASDTQVYIQGVTDEGVMTYDKALNEKIGLEKYKGQVDKTTVQNVYKVRWIVGTDYVFDYGIDDAISREGKKGNKRPMPNFVVYQNVQSSLVDRIIPKIDEINRLEFKERHILSQMIPQPAMKIDLSLMEETISLGGVTYNMKDLTDYFVKKGILYHRSKNEFGEDTGSQRSPIEFINTPEVSQLLQLKNTKALAIQEIKDLVGVNDIADGTQTSAELAVGVTQLQNNAVNNALLPLITAWRQFSTNIGKVLMRQYETLLCAGKEIEGVYFDNIVRKEYKITQEILSEKAEYAFSMELAPTYEEKQLMLTGIASAFQRGGLTTSEMILAQTLIINDDIKAAQYFMAKAEKKKDQENHQRQMEVTQGQAKAQGDAAVQAEQAKMQSAITIANAESANRLKEIELMHTFKMQELELTHGQKVDLNDNAAYNNIVSKTAMLPMQQTEQGVAQT